MKLASDLPTVLPFSQRIKSFNPKGDHLLDNNCLIISQEETLIHLPMDESTNRKKSQWLSQSMIKLLVANHSASNVVFNQARRRRGRTSHHIVDQIAERENPQFSQLNSKNAQKTLPTTCESVKPSFIFDFSLAMQALKEFATRKTSIGKKTKETGIPGTYSSSIIGCSTISQIVRGQSEEELLAIMTSSKESSLVVQAFISECAENELQMLARKISSHIHALAFHRFGNFVIQRLVLNYPPITWYVLKMAKKNFANYIMDEHSSRLLECLIERFKNFRDFSVSFFKKSFYTAISCNSACLLQVACLKTSEDSSSCDFVISKLINEPQLIKNKFFRKLINTCIRVGSQHHLDTIAEWLDVGGSFCSLFDRKWSAGLVSSLLESKHQHTVDCFYHQLTWHPAKLFCKAFFVQYVEIMWNTGTSLNLEEAAMVMIKLGEKPLKKLGGDSYALSNYIMLIITGLKETHYSALSNFLSLPFISKFIELVIFKSRPRN